MPRFTFKFDAPDIARRAKAWARPPEELHGLIEKAKTEADPAGNGNVRFQDTWMTIPQAEEVLAELKKITQ